MVSIRKGRMQNELMKGGYDSKSINFIREKGLNKIENRIKECCSGNSGLELSFIGQAIGSS
jgi:hypothetical protein